MPCDELISARGFMGRAACPIRWPEPMTAFFELPDPCYITECDALRWYGSSMPRWRMKTWPREVRSGADAGGLPVPAVGKAVWDHGHRVIQEPGAGEMGER